MYLNSVPPKINLLPVQCWMRMHRQHLVFDGTGCSRCSTTHSCDQSSRHQCLVSQLTMAPASCCLVQVWMNWHQITEATWHNTPWGPAPLHLIKHVLNVLIKCPLRSSFSFLFTRWPNHCNFTLLKDFEKIKVQNSIASLESGNFSQDKTSDLTAK